MFNHPNGLAVDGDSLWVADGGNSLLRKITISTTSVQTVAGTLGMPGNKDDTGTNATVSFGGFVQGMAVDGQHNVYFSGGVVVRKIDPSAVVTTIAGNKTALGLGDGIGSAALFGGINDLAFDGFHTLFITDTDAVRQLDLTTLQVTTLLGSTTQKGVKPGALPTTVNYAAGIDMTDTGDVLFTDFFENVVLRLRTQ